MVSGWSTTPGTRTIAAAVLATVAMVEVVLREPSQPQVSLLLAVIGTLPLAAARRLSFPVALVITAALEITASRRVEIPTAVVVSLAIAAYLVGRHRTSTEGAIVVVPFALVAVTQPWGDDTSTRLDMIGLLVVALGAVATGRGLRGRAEAAAHEATERALDSTLRENAERAERARIARELHDVVAHHISMISVQAETARLTTPGLPAEGARQLSAIGDTARTALTEMRRLLGVLREPAGTTADRTPQPGLAQLTELVDAARASTGSTVRLVVHGSVQPLDPGLELVAYRIVQEALTNARRHAPEAAVDVELDYGAEALRVTVRDFGPGPARDARPGHGVLGMRERATMVGGTLSAGAAPGGGYVVNAVLPRRAPE